ncbi:porin [Breoghania sp.]|uniref:porin n=1 Tax=Breoghania sp. TaxID=2065378 RepID=UPI002AA84456|nr:porin [Breoghania sp.]
MTIKTLILGAAAGTLAVAGAQAADLPVAPEPVDYVRVCDAYGSGFFYIPGTETCLRVGGGMRVEYRFNDFADDVNTNWGTRGGDATSTRARAYVRFDSRTNTEYGLLRTYVDLWFTGNSTGTANNPTVTLWNGFIQFGGFTFGRAESFFDFYTGDAWGIMQQGFSDHRTNLFAYTYGFGNGVSATLSVEDATFVRNGIANVARNSSALYGGHKMPDLVANLRVDQGWGSAQLMGAVHQVWGGNALQDSAVGWAIGAGVTFNAPMLAAGDTISFQGTYSDGAVRYVHESAAIWDAAETVAGTSMETTTGWGIGAGLTHHWTPMLSSALTATYVSFDNDRGALPDIEVDQLGIQGNLVWSPVKGFLMGVELEYESTEQEIGGVSTDDDDLMAIFRVQRTF